MPNNFNDNANKKNLNGNSISYTTYRTNYSNDEAMKENGGVPSGGDDTKVSTNTEATIDVSQYTEPVVIEPAEGYDATKKTTVTLSNIPQPSELTDIYYQIINLSSDSGDRLGINLLVPEGYTVTEFGGFDRYRGGWMKTRDFNTINFPFIQDATEYLSIVCDVPTYFDDGDDIYVYIKLTVPQNQSLLYFLTITGFTSLGWEDIDWHIYEPSTINPVPWQYYIFDSNDYYSYGFAEFPPNNPEDGQEWSPDWENHSVPFIFSEDNSEWQQQYYAIPESYNYISKDVQ